MPETATEIRTAHPGTLSVRQAPAGLPPIDVHPPTIAESGDPFSAARILHLVAQVDRGRPIRLDDIVAALDRRYLDWLFSRRVVADALLALQANWRTDYRTTAGIELEDGSYGPTVTIEDSPRVDPWIVRQVDRQIATCREILTSFSRLDRTSGDG